MMEPNIELECIELWCDAMQLWLDQNYWHYDYWYVSAAIHYYRDNQK